MDFETLRVREEGAVLFADIAAPPMNLLGTELVRGLVSLIQRAGADATLDVLVFGSADPDHFPRRRHADQGIPGTGREADRRRVDRLLFR